MYPFTLCCMCRFVLFGQIWNGVENFEGKLEFSNDLDWSKNKLLVFSHRLSIDAVRFKRGHTSLSSVREMGIKLFVECYFLTLFYVHQNCSRRLWKDLPKHMKHLYKGKYNFWKISWKHWGKIRSCSFWQIVSQSILLHRRRKVSACGKGLIEFIAHASNQFLIFPA